MKLQNHKSEEEERRRRSECIFLSTEERRSDLKTQKLLQVPMASTINSKRYLCNNWGHIRHYCPTVKSKEAVQDMREH